MLCILSFRRGIDFHGMSSDELDLDFGGYDWESMGPAGEAYHLNQGSSSPAIVPSTIFRVPDIHGVTERSPDGGQRGPIATRDTSLEAARQRTRDW